MRQCSHLLNSLTAPAALSARIPRTHRSICPDERTSTWIRSAVSTLRRHGSTSSPAPLSIGFSRSLRPTSSSSCRGCDRHYVGYAGIHLQARHVHTSSNSKWLARQSSDRFTREAKVQNLKSRAAFKLLQINDRHRIFRPGMTVVDLGYAPGSWSQVAIDLVRPGLGRVIGVDVIPVQPPKGVSGIQGDFLSPDVQARVRDFVREADRGRLKRSTIGDEVQEDEASYIDRERALTELEDAAEQHESQFGNDDHSGKCVDVVLSDMSAPWELTSGLFKNTISNPYRRMMNTTGNKFRDHAGSMDLCRSALYFSYATLKIGGHFVCKFYQGAEDKTFERQLKAMFTKVHREKPESSRSESREAFFVGIKRLAKVDEEKVFDET